MFVQVIKGKTTDPGALRAQVEKWQAELRPGATGYVGTTIGVTADNRFVAIACFADDASAKENANRPEQDAWFKEFAALVDGTPTFQESDDTSTMFDGPSEKAGFVQVMESTCVDRAKAEALEGELLEDLRQARPDLLGALRVWLDNNRCLEAAYFTTEADARKGEQSAEFGEKAQGFMSLFSDMTFLDLPNPQVRLA